MVRFVIIGVVIGVAFTLYALIDAAMTDARRARGLSKPVWIVLVAVLPVVGAALWFSIGKDRGPIPPAVRAPEDDPRFSGTRMSGTELDAHMRELEDRLRELDAETFPGEDAASAEGAAPEAPGETGNAARADREHGVDGRPAGGRPAEGRSADPDEPRAETN